MNALEVKNLSKTYGSFHLNNISFQLPSGCILGLIGQNGAGKTTTIKLLLDMIKRDSGTITILGKDNQTNFEATKEDIGVVLDESGFPDGITVRQVNQIMKHTYTHWNASTFNQYIQRFSLPKTKAFKEFSRGMKMKLSIAVALSHNAKLLILDEATSGLDPIIRDEILDIFYDFTKEESHSILLSSHIVSDLEKLCDYIAFIHQGTLLFYEEKDRLLESYGIVRCSKEQYETLPPESIVGVRHSTYGIEAMVDRTKLALTYAVSQMSIEDMIVFMAKGVSK